MNVIAHTVNNSIEQNSTQLDRQLDRRTVLITYPLRTHVG